MCQGPKDIPETVAQASAAAAKAIGLLCKDKLTCNPCVAHSDEMMCNGCSLCANVCPYGAITYVDKEFRMPDRTTAIRRVSSVNPAVCPVSYTHLDVYKRQFGSRSFGRKEWS